MRTRTQLAALVLSFFVSACGLHALILPGTPVFYGFDSLTEGQTSPFLNLAPESGLPSFRASFTSGPVANGFFASAIRNHPYFSGLNLMDGSLPTPNTLTVELSQPVTRVTLDFALFQPGRMELHSAAGTATLDAGYGMLSFNCPTGITEFTLQSYIPATGQKLLFSIDNLSLTVVPEPSVLALLLMGGAAGFIWRRGRAV